MFKRKKQGSILFRNVVFILIIMLLYVTILKMQNLNLTSMRRVLITKDVINKVDAVKYELYFNNQHLYIDEEVYINVNNINLSSPKELHLYFENNINLSSGYLHIKLDRKSNVIDINYIKNEEIIFKDRLTL